MFTYTILEVFKSVIHVVLSSMSISSIALMNSYDIIIRTPSYAISSYMSCHILNYAMTFHHIFYIIIHAMSSLPLYFLWLILSSPFVFPLSFTAFTLPSCPLLILCHSWTILTSMTTIIHISNTYTQDIQLTNAKTFRTLCMQTSI